MQVLAFKSGDEVVLMTAQATTATDSKVDLLSDPSERRVAKGGDGEGVQRRFEEIKGVVQTIAISLGEALRNVPEYDEVSLEFGVKVGGKAGIPFVTEGSAEANFKIAIKWKAPDKPGKLAEPPAITESKK